MASVDVQLPAAAAAAAAPPFAAARTGTEKTRQTHDVDTVLHFFKDNEDGTPPAPAYADRPETHNRPTASHAVHITDVTGDEANYTLDKDGFQFVKNTAEEKDFNDDDHIKAVYYPETENLLKDVTGASKIFIFGHTIRRPAGAAEGRTPTHGPVQRVHIDQTYAAARERVSHHLPAAEAAALLRGRVQIINVWRPLATVRRDPLAVARAGTVAEEDLVPIGLVYPTRRGETFSVRHTPAQRWFYKHALTPAEVLLIKCFDSKTDGRARRVPHSAFVDPAADGPDIPPRESIEVRALVFHPDDRD